MAGSEFAGVRVSGYQELQRAFGKYDKDAKKALAFELRLVADSVRGEAERLASSEISRMTSAWSQMRVGITSKSVYVAPKKRGTKNPALRRSAFGTQLLDSVLYPALAANVDSVGRDLDSLLGRVGRANGF